MKSGIFAAILAVAAFGCSNNDHYILRTDVNNSGEAHGSFKIDKAGLYSVALETVVNPSDRARAFDYLNNIGYYEPIKVVVVIKSTTVGGTFTSKTYEVSSPRPSSWNSTDIYSELVRVKLVNGKYGVYVSFSGGGFAKQRFTNHIIIEQSYTGK